MPPAWTLETGLPSKIGIPELWDTTVPIISGACTYTISSLPYHGLGKTISAPGCCTSTYYFSYGPHRLGHGSRSRAGAHRPGLQDTRACLRHSPQTKLVDESVIQGTFQLFRLWARVLFDYGASHSFIAASCVKDLGLEVETLEDSLHVSSPLGTRVRVD